MLRSLRVPLFNYKVIKDVLTKVHFASTEDQRKVAAEYAEKTIKGAINVPYKEKSAKEAGFDRKQDSFDLARLPADKNAPLVFFCNAGECWKSYKASVVARDAGYRQIHWFRGGFPEWNSRGLPTQ